MNYTILNVVVPDEYTFEKIHEHVKTEFAKYSGNWVEIGFALWVLEPTKCAALIHWMESLCLAQKISFVSATFDGPLRCAVEENKAGDLKKLGVDVQNVTRK